MGIVISYKGSLSDPALHDEAIREIREFCAKVGWPCEDYSEHYSGVILSSQAQADGDPGLEERESEPWPELPAGKTTSIRARVSRLYPPDLIEETVRGVYVIPPDTESLRLVFDGTGRLVKYFDFPVEFVIDAIPDTVHYIAFSHFVKTSGAPASHAAICVLLRMLQKKFIPNLVVDDDTGYWKTGDVDRLTREHALMGAVLGLFRSSENVGALLRNLGVALPEGKVELLDPHVAMPSPPKKTAKKTKSN